MPPQRTIPSGLCECGCGEQTPLARKTFSAQGIYRGHPLRFVPGHRRKLPSVERLADDADRFWSQVDRRPGANSCWLWQAGTIGTGYGEFYVRLAGRKRMILAHRVAYELAFGPPGDACVLHKCDTPRCVRPDHLFLGTRNDNVQDMIRKGRNAPIARRFGTAHHGAKLTPAAVIEARRLHREGASVYGLAARFGVAASTMTAVVRHRTWRDVADPSDS